MHIVTAYSDCDSSGRRAECHFMIIVRGMEKSKEINEILPWTFYNCVRNLLEDFVEPFCGERDIDIALALRCMCILCECVVPSVWICSNHNFYIYEWISKYQ